VKGQGSRTGAWAGLERTAVVLVRTQEEGNLGAAARAMANMGLERLVLVAPRSTLGPTARAFAVGAGHVLDGAVVVPTLDEALAPFVRVVGTTSARGRSEATVTPRELAAELAADPGPATALVFGPEASGLTVPELARCSRVVRVPCAATQPTLNVAQAVLLLAYELHLARPAGAQAASAEPRAADGEVEALFGQLRPLLETVGFARDDTFEGVVRDLRRAAARAALTEREVAILRGICRRAAHRLGTGDG
jgi:TrmH family RNA methyltransferase